jgi:subtilase family serine protease
MSRSSSHHRISNRKTNAAARSTVNPFAALEMLERRTLLSAVGIPEVTIAGTLGADGSTAASSSALTPAEIRAAYGVSSIALPGVATANGAGPTIAIIDAYNDPNALSDLETFDSTFGLANPPSFKVLNETGGTTLPANDTADAKPDTWELEESLDIEWAHAIAPGANIDLFEANSTSLSDLFTAVETAKSTAGVSVVSMSFSSSGDFTGETSYDADFTSTSSQNVTFLSATGDSGEAPGFPAVSPNVVGVGGTTLSTNSSGAYLGETAWSGSAGGLSTVESQPSYQKGVVTQSTTKRADPDVSMDANPNTGVALYDSYDGSSTGGNWFQVGGTSLATPMWAGLVAIADQGRAAKGLKPLDGATGTLPALYSLPSTDFHDIASGSNAQYSATTGYDLVTGLGSPIANNLVPALAAYSGSTTTAPTPPTTQAAPTIASLTSSASPATVNKVFTLTANGVADSTSTIASVSFYYGSTLLGTVTNGSGGYKINLTASAAGSYTLSAVAKASNGLTSAPTYLTLTVQKVASAGTRFALGRALNAEASMNSVYASIDSTFGGTTFTPAPLVSGLDSLDFSGKNYAYSGKNG